MSRLSKESRELNKRARNAIFNKAIKKKSPWQPKGQEDRKEVSRKLADDIEAFKADGGRIQKVASRQVPPKKRPAMQHYGNGGFYHE